MTRLLFAIILSAILVGLSTVSYGFGDAAYTLETWIGAFILPIWSLATTSLWYDVGRLIWSNTFKLDSHDSVVSNNIRSIVFVIWMSIVLTYITWIHISLFAIPLLLVIPFLAIPFRDYLLHDWTVRPTFTREQYIALAFWATTSYLVYWLLTIGWILLRIWLMDATEDGVVFFIK